LLERKISHQLSTPEISQGRHKRHHRKESGLEQHSQTDILSRALEQEAYQSRKNNHGIKIHSPFLPSETSLDQLFQAKKDEANQSRQSKKFTLLLLPKKTSLQRDETEPKKKKLSVINARNFPITSQGSVQNEGLERHVQTGTSWRALEHEAHQLREKRQGSNIKAKRRRRE